MKKKPKAKPAEPACLHCRIVAMILADHPDGMDLHEADEILRAIAIVAADILQHGNEAALQGFGANIRRLMQTDRAQFRIIDRTLN